MTATVAPFEKLTYTPSEAAMVLGVSLWTVYRLLQRGILSSAPWSRHKLIPRAQVVNLANGIVRDV